MISKSSRSLRHRRKRNDTRSLRRKEARIKIREYFSYALFNKEHEAVKLNQNITSEAEGSALPPISETASVIEGILFTMGDSVELERIAKALEITEEEASAAIEELMKRYETESRGIRILKLENAYQMSTAPEIYEYLIKIAGQPKKQVLTDVLLETLSIIAYKQPVTKAEIEKIRGVSCDHAVSKLVEYRLVEELGRLDAPGRPMLFGTTEDFLRSFGVGSISELPVLNPVQVEEFKLQAEAEANETLAVDI